MNLAELVDVPEFFAPAPTDLITNLVGQYRQERERILEVAKFANSTASQSVLAYFLSGNATEERGRSSMELSAKQLFQEDGAVASLNAAYWSKALALTDVYDAMPQNRRNQWNDQIRNPKGRRKSYNEIRFDRDRYPERFNRDGEFLNPEDAWDLKRLPDFEEETVRITLQDLLAARARFLAERVDGIFRALSGVHVTNSPAAFGKRMIIAHLVTSFGTSDHDRVGYINDLRCVIAKFMGRDEPRWNATTAVVERARRQFRGQWVSVDGGAMRLRAYKCGTAHLEVHPDMAWRLNCVLAHLYPLAIPPEFRSKPRTKPKGVAPMGRPLLFKVVDAIASLTPAYILVENKGPDAWRQRFRQQLIPNAVQFERETDSAVLVEAEAVLANIGAIKVSNGRAGHYYQFAYLPDHVLDEIICSGCLPDRKTHQYYYTPEPIADEAIALAEIGDGDFCLEPSAGQGALASRMPKKTLCVEISALHCKILQAKGYTAINADFLDWADRQLPTPRRFDRIVMNPPFSEGRWQAHVEHAAALLRAGGRLVAILPAGAKGKNFLPGLTVSWSRVYENEFAGTSIAVVLMSAIAP